MINANFREYNYFTLGERDEYGQIKPATEPKGKVKIAIYTLSQSTTTNINYANATYIGLTQDNKVNDTYIIEIDNKRLKVMYVNREGRLKQVYLTEVANG